MIDKCVLGNLYYSISNKWSDLKPSNISYHHKINMDNININFLAKDLTETFSKDNAG